DGRAHSAGEFAIPDGVESGLKHRTDRDKQRGIADPHAACDAPCQDQSGRQDKSAPASRRCHAGIYAWPGVHQPALRDDHAVACVCTASAARSSSQPTAPMTTIVTKTTSSWKDLRPHVMR